MKVLLKKYFFRRSSSLEISAPIKPRLRDRSSDFSLNGIERISTRPRTSILDSKYEAKDYKVRNMITGLFRKGRGGGEREQKTMGKGRKKE